ncbi:hypothetical protein [Bradyrhizobium diazoefficiens]|uniref:hypothetical protein n=1 Tax=Bradyrhizobium diazoefficiens TaxID=1355477 RepID=UPI002714B5ED|nr:hypothetical protein [Bradyrhizobium diazoefficiens]WLB35600.1 hypothetical protein QIH78_29525 [Bradyrhizobium diazoefficiens]WLC19408.1 hypothetical protein QIH76_14145 [Bradyrhizobium diazoefficiens]
MRLLAVASVLITSFAVGQTAKAFDGATERLMRLHIASYLVNAECDDGYVVNNDGFKRWADKSGYPWRVLVPSVHAALMAGEDGKYKEQDLIPEVTQMVRAIEKPLEEELDRDKGKFCAELGGTLVSEGLMNRVK